ncbi:MAG: hypothetical protein ACLPQS_16430 [Acidimicrobiales bacterium]
MASRVRGLRWAFGALLALLAVTVVASPAFAAWSAGGAGGAGAGGLIMPTGGTPTVSANGDRVTVSWPAATFVDGAPVAGYQVNRYNSSTGAVQTIGSGCGGVVATTSCTELNVPDGTWIYTDTPVQLDWSGTASPASSSVRVAS